MISQFLIADHQLFFFLNQFLYQSHIGNWIIDFFARHAIFFAGYLFLVSVYAITKEYRKRISILTAGLIAVTLTHLGILPIVHNLTARVRPFLALAVPHLFEVNSYSFPSGHTAFVCVLAGVLYPYKKSYAYICMLIGICIGIARIIAGVHYPSDIIAWAVLGWIIGYVFARGVQKIKL